MTTKRLLIIAVLSTMLLWTVTVFCYYLLNYPEDFSLIYVLKENLEWKPLLSIYFALILAAITDAYLYKRNGKDWKIRMKTELQQINKAQ